MKTKASSASSLRRRSDAAALQVWRLDAGGFQAWRENRRAPLQNRHGMANLAPRTGGISNVLRAALAAAALDTSDFAGLQALAEAAGKKLVRGVVLYLGEQVVPRGDNLWALPIDELWRPARK